MYKQPPQEHKFIKGKSGNPNGWPKSYGIKNFTELINKLIEVYIIAQSGHKPSQQKLEDVKKLLEN